MGGNKSKSEVGNEGDMGGNSSMPQSVTEEADLTMQEGQTNVLYIIGSGKLVEIRKAFKDAKRHFTQISEEPPPSKDSSSAQTLITYFETICVTLDPIIQAEEEMQKIVKKAIEVWSQNGVQNTKEHSALYKSILTSLEKLEEVTKAQLGNNNRAENTLYRGAAPKDVYNLQQALQKFKHLIAVNGQGEIQSLVVTLTDTLETLVTQLMNDVKSVHAFKQALMWCPGKGEQCAKRLFDLHAQINKIKESGELDAAGRAALAARRKQKLDDQSTDQEARKKQELADHLNRQMWHGRAENALIRDVLAYYH